MASTRLLAIKVRRVDDRTDCRRDAGWRPCRAHGRRRQGPAGLDWTATNHPLAYYIVTVPADGPFVPRNLVDHLTDTLATEDAELVTAASGAQTHPVVGLLPVRLRQALHDALAKEDVHKVDAWTRRFRRAIATFPADPFFNANTPEQLAEAERLAALHPDI